MDRVAENCRPPHLPFRPIVRQPIGLPLHLKAELAAENGRPPHLLFPLIERQLIGLPIHLEAKLAGLRTDLD